MALFRIYSCILTLLLFAGEKDGSTGVRHGVVGPPERISRGRKSQLPRRQQGEAAGYPCRQVSPKQNPRV